MTERRVQLHALVLATVVLCGVASPADAMYYSHWSTLNSDGNVAWAYSQVDDLSGCASGVQYMNDAVYSPSRYGSSLELNDEEGQWLSYSTAGIYCACGGHVMEFGASSGGWLQKSTFSVEFKYVGEVQNFAAQVKVCNYDACTSNACGITGMVDQVGLYEVCPAGVLSGYEKKTFLGFTYSCPSYGHTHLPEAPC